MEIMTIIRLDAALRAAGIPIDGVSGNQGSIRVDYQASATAAQILSGQAIVATFDWSDAATAQFNAKLQKDEATAVLDRSALQAAIANERLHRSVVLVVLDEFNNHATFEASLLAAIAAATSLADLKIRVAAISAIPQRTALQLLNAVKAKIAATVQ